MAKLKAPTPEQQIESFKLLDLPDQIAVFNAEREILKETKKKAKETFESINNADVESNGKA